MTRHFPPALQQGQGLVIPQTLTPYDSRKILKKNLKKYPVHVDTPHATRKVFRASTGPLGMSTICTGAFLCSSGERKPPSMGSTVHRHEYILHRSLTNRSWPCLVCIVDGCAGYGRGNRAGGGWVRACASWGGQGFLPWHDGGAAASQSSLVALEPSLG